MAGPSKYLAMAVTGGLLLSAGCATKNNQRSAGGVTHPKPDRGFGGRAAAASGTPVAAWPEPVRASKGAPNVVLILVDDVGFSATSTFGGAIPTPNFDKLASEGLRYNNFHVNALCSPTRASLLSGRNNHRMGFGTVAESASGFPGYNSLWPRGAASVAEVLKDNGYSTAAFGKWHNTPVWQVTPAGPFNRWPTGLGFEHFYGFLAGYDNQYYPRLFNDTVAVEPPASPQQGYNLTTDMTTQAIRWMHQQEAVYPDKPFFLYFAPGATHTPHQVPQSWIEKFRGKFDGGWDELRRETFARQKKLGVIPANAELTPRPPGLPAWSSLAPDEQKLLAHQMEVYAAFTAQADHEIGRLLDDIRTSGRADNTLVIEIFGDNGASAEGTLEGYDARDVRGRPLSIQRRLAVSREDGSDVFMNHFAAAWAWALTSPFPGTKMDASHLGGTTDPMIISWPARIHDRGGLRTQFQHVTDIAPTIYQAAGIEAPSVENGTPQISMDGSSLLYTFDHPEEASHHHMQYFATLGNLGIYKDGWWAGRHLWDAWDLPGAAHPDAEKQSWELYDLRNDYSQAQNLARQDPARLRELRQLFEEEARRNQVYPIFQPAGPQPSPANGRTLFEYRDGVDRLPNAVAPRLAGRPYLIRAEIEVPPQGAKGVLLAQGSRYGGLTLFVDHGHVVFEVNAFGNCGGRLVSRNALHPGRNSIVVQADPESLAKGRAAAEPGLPPVRPGKVSLLINDATERTADFQNLNGSSYTETLDVGRDLGSPVSPRYKSPDAFTGTIDRITIQLLP